MMVDQNRPRVTSHKEVQFAENGDLTEQLIEYILNGIRDDLNEKTDEEMLTLGLFAP